MTHEKPLDGTWFRHDDDVYAAFYSVKYRAIGDPHRRVMQYIIQRTWGHTQGKSKRSRSTFVLDRTHAAEETYTGKTFCDYYYALLNAYILYEENGEVGVDNHMERWDLARLEANPRMRKSALLADEVFLLNREKFRLDREKSRLDRAAKLLEAANSAEPAPPKEYKKEEKTTFGKKPGKKTEDVGVKETPDNPSDSINAIASKLYDTFAEKRGYKKEVNWLALRNMIKTLIKQGYNEEQMVGCLVYLATVDNYFKDGKVDWSLLKIKDKIGWYVKNVHKDKPTTPVKSEGSALDDLYKNFQR